ncbi:DUF2460 domain-containing protein [Altericroceibacterium xinjiangense]|uniref:DUF2460 domain-containing protein n=1 Tax=Altericroceibacterium xinjiangense TaxID=762261 RepID=UPI000F7D75D0|nr:DUF2460 domain-containing protein [Altericroceibacterium xinjiangense]
MAFWLAQKRDGEETDHIQRFDPRFWTVDFPRPTMASVVTTGPDSLRVDVEVHHASALVGLIWDSEDRLDHPLLAYDTDRDYSRTTLRFRWRSGGVIPLDAVNGPTLTIEGRDSGGEPHSWFVRLWNYASGTPEDALVELPFSRLSGGWDLPEGADPVHPSDIDRMFISIAPPGFDPVSSALLPDRANGWVELTGIACEGDRAMLKIGDVLLPPHGIGMATAYDDCYNQTPARVLRTLRGLGYRGAITHYVGMSHYYRLFPDVGGTLLAFDAVLAGPAEAWHAAYFGLCKAQGYAPIPSLSYELLAQHCPADWQQRAANGEYARTGWDPPSTLLSPANDAAIDFLCRIAGHFVDLLRNAGLPLSFQIGEPWWWVMPEGRICLYDDNALAIFGADMPVIEDIRAPLNADEQLLLDKAGELLAASTARLRDAVREASGGAVEVMLLVFTPTVLDPSMPEAHRANMPVGWAWPAYDRLQVEDYDWLTAGAEALRKAAYDTVQERLGYPLQHQDYISGFVLKASDAEALWPRIDVGLEEAMARGVPRCFVWASPQVCRDGYTRLPAVQDETMQAFDDVLYPLALGKDAGVSPEFSTSISVTASGHERRSSQWTDARLRFDVGPGLRSEAELGVLIAFFRARRGAARGFRLGDPFDHSSNGMTGTPTMLDQRIGVGDGLTASFQLVKRYGDGDEPQVRPITRPRADTVRLSIDGAEASAWTLRSGGIVTFTSAPPAGSVIRAGFLFDVPVRFAEDRLDITGATFAAGEAPSVPLIEVREVA